MSSCFLVPSFIQELDLGLEAGSSIEINEREYAIEMDGTSRDLYLCETEPKPKQGAAVAKMETWLVVEESE